MTINILADQYIAAKEILDRAEAEVKALKAEILALGVERVEGARGFVNVGLSERLNINAKAVEAKFGRDWILENAKITIDAACAKLVKKKLGKDADKWIGDHSDATLIERLTIEAKPVGTLVVKALENLDA